MAHVYTMRKNAVRAAKAQGLPAEAVVEQRTGGFVILAEEMRPAAPPAPAEPPARARRKAAAPKTAGPRPGTKNATLLHMLTREGGATEAQLTAALGWKPASVRCSVQRVTKAHGHTWRFVKGEDGAKSRWEASPAA